MPKEIRELRDARRRDPRDQPRCSHPADASKRYLLEKQRKHIQCSYCSRVCVSIDSKLQHEFDSHIWLGGAEKWARHHRDRTDLGLKLESVREAEVDNVRYRNNCPHCTAYFRLPCDLRQHELVRHKGRDIITNQGRYAEAAKISRSPSLLGGNIAQMKA